MNWKTVVASLHEITGRHFIPDYIHVFTKTAGNKQLITVDYVMTKRSSLPVKHI